MQDSMNAAFHLASIIVTLAQCSQLLHQCNITAFLVKVDSLTLNAHACSLFSSILPLDSINSFKRKNEDLQSLCDVRQNNPCVTISSPERFSTKTERNPFSMFFKFASHRLIASYQGTLTACSI